MVPRPPSVVEAASSVFTSIYTQRNQSLQRIEQNALPIQEWLKLCIECRKQEVTLQKSEDSKQPAKKKTKVETGLAQDVLDYIYSLRVKDLQGMLSERHLDQKGLKKDLQRRLIEAMEQEALSQQESSSSPGSNAASSTASSSRPLLGEVKPAFSSDMDKEELSFKSDDDDEEMQAIQPARTVEVEEIKQPIVVVESMQSKKQAQKPMDIQQQQQQQPKQQPAPASEASPKQQSRTRSPLRHFRSGMKSALRALSPSKQKSNVGSMVEKLESGIKDPKEEQTYASLSSADDVQTKSTMATTTKPAHALETPHSNMGLMSGPARVMTAGGGTMSSKQMRSGGGSKLSKSMIDAQNARRAKLAEIRSKSKPVVSSATATNSATSSFAKVKPFGVQSSKSKNHKEYRTLASKMREKTATLQKTEPSKFENAKMMDQSKFENATMMDQSSADAQMKENQPSKPSETKENSPLKENSPTKKALMKENSPTKEQSMFTSFSSLQSGVSKSSSALNEVTNSPGISKTKQPIVPESSDGVAKMKSPSPIKPSSPLMSPMDTYELSDREQSDSDSEDEEYSKPKKRIPQWAQKSNLMPALEHQFTKANHDPDKIFGEVHTCDLQAIFDQKKSRYQRRTSSGNWTQDRATAAEKLAYKRSQGYGGEE